MALINLNAFNIKGEVELSTSYFRISEINIMHTGTYIISKLLIYKDTAAYHENPNNNIVVNFNTSLKINYDRYTDGEDVLLFVHESWITQLYSLFPEWQNTGLEMTILNK